MGSPRPVLEGCIVEDGLPSQALDDPRAPRDTRTPDPIGIVTGMRFVPEAEQIAWFATMYGVGDVEASTALPQALGLGGVRITDIIQRSLDDLVDDPEGKLSETDHKIARYTEAGLFAILDLSYIRNALVEAGINPYRSTPETDWIIRDAVTAVVTRRNTHTGVFYGEEPIFAYVALGGEPEGFRWGEDHRRADSFDELCAWYERVAGYWREFSDIPTSTGGIMNFGHPDSNLDFPALAALPCNEVPTVHIYEEHDLAALPDAVAAAHALDKPLVLEELGLDQAHYLDDDTRATAYRDVFATVLAAGVDGVGLWNIGQGGGHDINPHDHQATAHTIRQATAAQLL
ncbi:MAG: hypothetical protein Q4D79_11110 [Propionibacteriaceae bacterium]|nr:hypothetical protein [Propionibacteriaceae bacterium]